MKSSFHNRVTLIKAKHKDAYNLAIMDTEDKTFADSGTAYNIDHKSKTIFMNQEMFYRVIRLIDVTVGST